MLKEKLSGTWMGILKKHIYFVILNGDKLTSREQFSPLDLGCCVDPKILNLCGF